MKNVPRTYWYIFAFAAVALAGALLIFVFGKKQNSPDIYPGPLRGQAQLVPLGKGVLLSELAAEQSSSGRDIFCSFLSSKARQQIDLNPHLSCSMPVEKDGHSDDEPSAQNQGIPPTYDAPADKIVVFVRAFEVRDVTARLAAVSCAQNRDPETGKRGVFVTPPRFARAGLFEPGTELLPSRTKDDRVRTPGGVWLLTDFFEDLTRRPTAQEIKLSWQLYKQMRQQAPWCPLPKELR